MSIELTKIEDLCFRDIRKNTIEDEKFMKWAFWPKIMSRVLNEVSIFGFVCLKVELRDV